MNHYPRHVGDFIRATIGLSLAERGAYSALLDQYYANEAPVPLDARERYRMVGAVSKADRVAVDYVVGRYFTEQADGWHNRRADAEIAMYQIRSDKARENGAKGGRPPNQKETDSVISANPEVTGSKTNPEPVTQNHKPEGQEQRARKRATRLSDDWEIPPDWAKWAASERSDWGERDVIRVSLLFRDHWRGKGEARADWEATWRNWVRRERDPPTKVNGSVQSIHDRRAATAAAMYGEKDGNRQQGTGTERDITGESERVA